MSSEVLSYRDRNGREYRGVELYREGSGAYVVALPDEMWLKQLRQLASSNYGRMTVVLQPTTNPGYKGQHGVRITLVPGCFAGDDGYRTTLEERKPIHADDLPLYGNTDYRNFGIETSLEDAAALHAALGEILANAGVLSKPKAA